MLFKRCNCSKYFGEGDGTLLQYSCLENPMDGGTWLAAVHGVAKSRTWLKDFTLTFHFYALEKEMATHSCSCLENPRDGGAWWAAIYGVTQSRTRLKWVSSSSKYLLTVQPTDTWIHGWINLYVKYVMLFFKPDFITINLQKGKFCGRLHIWFNFL